ncbi:hypothetical protein Mal64_34630 [Pseudobythopirellula maris]|uniref:Uncharacterized protein n=1 Tax=Pseudobythopirellula maris TaxID=2527991 RepID=A0A5C5ZH37_9BACT|nr:hypothetical protein [Pseudobythopirellula maris]TWT86634.1 hypothetical protein Mal64_34630 [Pseudobythopirellula maris]
MRRLGVAQSANAIAEFREHGGEPEHLGALLAHAEARPLAWDGGAVYRRVCGWRPGDLIEAGWPPVSDAQRRANEQHSSARRADRQAEHEEHNRRIGEAADRRREFRLALSGLPATEQERLLGMAQPDWREQGIIPGGRTALSTILKHPEARHAAEEALAQAVA